MSGLHLRIGIWFDESHVPFGGPSVVLTGVVLGLYQWADCEGVKITIIFNKSGDYNWSLYAIDESNSHNLLNLACGPFVYNHADVCTDYASSPAWKNVKNILFQGIGLRI